MPAPQEPFIAVVIDPDGWPVLPHRHFATANAMRTGTQEMIRLAAPGSSVYGFGILGHLEMAITYNFVAGS